MKTIGLVVAFFVAATAMPATSTHTEYEYDSYFMEYNVGTSWASPVPGTQELPDNPTEYSRVMGGVMTCGGAPGTPAAPGNPAIEQPGLGGGQDIGRTIADARKILDAAIAVQPDVDGTGGACPDIIVEPGDEVSIFICETGADSVAQQGRECDDVSFAACVDGNGNGLCRPEEEADSLFVHTCGEGNGAHLRFTHDDSKDRGNLVIWIMQETGGNAQVCPAVTGWIHTLVAHPTQPIHECMDGLDNDGDGWIDWPADPGCDSPDDDVELTPSCSDGRDNDDDGLVDYPNDPGCSSPGDWTEQNPYVH